MERTWRMPVTGGRGAEPRHFAGSATETAVRPAEPAVTPASEPSLAGARRQLAERARAGDRDAFDAIVRTHADPIHRLARAILGTDAEACDATQETFVSAWRRIGDLRAPDLLEPWLRRIAVNACRQQLRRRGRSDARETPLPDDCTDLHPAERSPEDRTVEADWFDRAFGRLTVDERAVLILHHLEDRPVDEIAGVLGLRTGAVKSRLFRARAALESALREESR